MAGTTIAKHQIPDIRWNYTKGIINLREAPMIRSTSCLWAWTQSSRSTPTSPMHNLSSTSRYRRCSVEKLSREAPEEYDSWKLLASHGFREGIGSTHRGILETYTTSFKSKYYQLKSRVWLSSRGYKLPKALYIHGNDHKVIEYEGHCRIITQQGVLWSTTELMRVSVLYQRTKERKGIVL